MTTDFPSLPNPQASKYLVNIILESQKTLQNVLNNATQAWNHHFYWQSLTPGGNEALSDELSLQIEEDFGGLSEFKKQFDESAKMLFGSGWTWLVCDEEGHLSIMNTKDADNPIAHGLAPLLACDVWEHAYSASQEEEAENGLQNYWELVDWSFVEKNWRKASSQGHQKSF